MIFSERYNRALAARSLSVDLSDEVRSRIWTWIEAHDHSIAVRRDPNDNWISNSTVVEETLRELAMETGVRFQTLDGDSYRSAGQNLVLDRNGEISLSFIELFWNNLAEEQDAFSRRVNEIMRSYDCPWRMAEGRFFKLSSDFVAAESIEASHEAMINAGFETPAAEFAKGRDALATGDVREAISNAGHSYESVMKTILNVRKGNAKTLIDQLRDANYLSDLPVEDRNAFTEKVMQCATFMRNTFSGHGHGKDALNLPPAYGELALALAGALNSFLISLHLERQPSRPANSIKDESDIPF